MDKSDLLAFAREYSSRNLDLYELLGIDSLAAGDANEIKRAYRKQSIKYHPDKTGDAFDPEKWQLLERARDVLMDKAAKDAYDAARGAALREQERRKTMDAQKRRMIDELEARERGEDPNAPPPAAPKTAAELAEEERFESKRRAFHENLRRKRAEAEEEERREQELAVEAEDRKLAAARVQERKDERKKAKQERREQRAETKVEKVTNPLADALPSRWENEKSQDTPMTDAAPADGKGHISDSAPTAPPPDTFMVEQEKGSKYFLADRSFAARPAAERPSRGRWDALKPLMKAAQADRNKRRAERLAGAA